MLNTARSMIMMIPPTATPSSTISAGCSALTRRVIWSRTWLSKVRASFFKMLPVRPDSSPTVMSWCNSTGNCFVLASDTPSHRAILDESLAFFYSTKDVRSLKSALSKIRLGGKEVGEKVICAQNWAKQFTYQKRALKLLEFLGRKTTQ